MADTGTSNGGHGQTLNVGNTIVAGSGLFAGGNVIDFGGTNASTGGHLDGRSSTSPMTMETWIKPDSSSDLVDEQ